MAFGFALLPVVIAGRIAPKKPSPVKNTSYECGLESKGDSWIQFHVQYYLIALIFVVFDVEAVFLYPWAVSFKETGLEGFAAMSLFIGVLFLGLVYEWRKKNLDWE
ncbi:MAG: NADH-quinone oxidoreductase subunit A [Candidatus Omnitrophica bacterium]|nr:NADH-quinone oxidoreductase subunit A [Candidatus Omnitrophota bacterium]